MYTIQSGNGSDRPIFSYSSTHPFLRDTATQTFNILGQFEDLKGELMRLYHGIGTKKQNKAAVYGGRRGDIAGVPPPQDHIFEDTCRPR